MIENKMTLRLTPYDMYTLLASPINNQLLGAQVPVIEVTDVRLKENCFEITVSPEEEDE